MNSKLIPGFAALIPFVAFGDADSSQNAGIAPDELQSWTVEQLCASRSSPEVWGEIERRDIFHGRELRAIEKERVRDGMREHAVRCFKGWPASIIPAVSTVSDDPVDAWIYPAGEAGMLVIYLRRTEAESTVLTSMKTDDAEGMAPVASMRLSCKYSGSKVNCEAVEQDGQLNWGLYGPGTDQHGFPFGTRRSGADVSLPPTNLGSGTSAPQ